MSLAKMYEETNELWSDVESNHILTRSEEIRNEIALCNDADSLESKTAEISRMLSALQTYHGRALKLKQEIERHEDVMTHPDIDMVTTLAHLNDTHVTRAQYEDIYRRYTQERNARAEHMKDLKRLRDKYSQVVQRNAARTLGGK